MNVKFLMYVAICIVALTAVSAISDDSSADYEEYVVYGPHNNYDDDFTRFSLKAGMLSITSYEYYYDLFIVIGEEIIYTSSCAYVPYDTDDAYFYSSDSGVSTVKLDVINTPVEYEMKGKMYSGSNYSHYGEINPTLIKLNAGTYTFMFSRSGSLSPIDSGTEYRFDAGVETTITLDSGGDYYFRHDNYGQYYVNGAIPVYCTMSPGSIFEPTPDGLDMVKVTSGTTLKWYKQTIFVDSGTHDLYGSSRIYAFDDPVKATWFEDNIIGKGLSQPLLYDNTLGLLNGSFTLDSSRMLYIYSFSSSDDRYSDYITLDSESYDRGDLIVGGKNTNSLYLLANTVSKIMVDYDHAKYRIFLYDSAEKLLLPSGVMTELNNSISKEYWICVEPIFYNSPECYTAEYFLYTEGIPESDDNAPLFAVLCIGLCVVFFGLLFISGRKPKWKD